MNKYLALYRRLFIHLPRFISLFEIKYWTFRHPNRHKNCKEAWYSASKHPPTPTKLRVDEPGAEERVDDTQHTVAHGESDRVASMTTG